MPALPLWEGDRFISCRWFLTDDSPQFHGVMPYRDGKPVGMAVLDPVQYWPELNPNLNWAV